MIEQCTRHLRVRVRAARRAVVVAALACATAAHSAGHGLLETFSQPLTNAAIVRVVAEDAQGRLLVGGRIQFARGARAEGLARFRADGSVDASFRATVCRESPVDAVCNITGIAIASSGDVFVAGYNTWSNLRSPILAKLSDTGIVDTQWAARIPPGFDPLGTRLVIRGDSLYLLGVGAYDDVVNEATIAVRVPLAGGPVQSFVAPFFPSAGPGSVALDPAGNLVFVAQETVTLIDGTTGGIMAVHSLPAGVYWDFQPPLGLPLAVGGAIIVDGGGSTYAIDAQTGEVRTGWPIPSRPQWAVRADSLYAIGCRPKCSSARVERVPLADPAQPTPVTTPSSLEGARALLVRASGPVVALAGGDSTAHSDSLAWRVFDASGNADARFDDTLHTSAIASDILVDGRDAYVAGRFRRIADAVQPFLARWRDGGFDPSWRPAVSGSVASLARSGDRLVAGGSILAVDGRSAEGPARFGIAGNGAGDPWDPVPGGLYPGYVRQVVGDGAGGARAFGWFSSARFCGGLAREHSIHLLGGAECAAAPSFDPAVQLHFAVDGGDGWLYGWATGYDEVGVRRIDTTTGIVDRTWGTRTTGYVAALALGPDAVYWSESSTTNVLRRANRSDGLPQTWSSPWTGRAVQLAFEGGSLFVSGVESASSRRHRVRRLEAATGLVDLSWFVHTDAALGIRIAPFNAFGVVLAGDFTEVNGARRVGIAAYGASDSVFANSFD